MSIEQFGITSETTILETGRIGCELGSGRLCTAWLAMVETNMAVTAVTLKAS